ncbi:hypothetical protein [Sorangium sp. So ce176]|uniref:hypothetical protein n=1 Tax=Sorangium sp. So ce176 TaxID=3133286 RepID=UPI003F5F2817
MQLVSVGYELGQLPVELTKERVLEYFEGERLVLLRSGAKDPYLKVWSNTDGYLARWFIFRLMDSDVARFLHRDRSLRELILGARDGHVYLVDTRGASIRRVAFLRVKDIPEPDLPSEESYYDDTLTPECTANASTDQLVLLDGDWDATKLAAFERRYAQIYAFNALFGSESGNDIMSLENRFGNHTFTGSGWSYVHAFDQIVASSADKPQFVAIQVSSPGMVRYGVDADYGARVRSALATMRDEFEEVEKRYGALHDNLLWVTRQARTIEDEEVLDSFLSAPNEAIKQPAIWLANKLNLDPERVWFVCSYDVTAGELVAAYYRRLRELYKWELDTRAVVV